MEPENPGLFVLGCPGSTGEMSGSEQGPQSDEGAHSTHNETNARTEHGTDRKRTAELSGGLEGIFQARRDPRDFRRAGPMDPPSPPSHPTQALETRPHHLPRATNPRSLG